MFVAKVVFGRSPQENQREDLLDLAHCYFADLLKNGQVDGEYLLDWCDGELTAYVNVPRPKSFESRFLPKHARDSLEKLSQGFRRAPEWLLLSDRVPKRFPSWRSATFLFLYSGTFQERSPVHRGDDRVSIPTYLLPLTYLQRESIYFWMQSYRRHDHIWFDSGDLEIPAYKQMATPESGLRRSGRELCKTIERATGVKTFYYLFKYYGREGDEDRPCPICGRRWRLPPEGEYSCAEIQFLCNRCRLVSKQCDDRSSKRLARIGEYRRSAQQGT